MENTSLLQVRTSAEDKEKAFAILKKLTTNLSAVVNKLIKQIIITERKLTMLWILELLDKTVRGAFD